MAGLVFELYSQILRKCAFSEDTQMILEPYFANSDGVNFEKKCKGVQVNPTVVSGLVEHLFWVKMKCS